MAEFIVSWSPDGPSGRVQAESLAAAAGLVVTRLEALGVGTAAQTPSPDPGARWEGAVLLVSSVVPRYGDTGTLVVCVYGPGQCSYHDLQRRTRRTPCRVAPGPDREAHQAEAVRAPRDEPDTE